MAVCYLVAAACAALGVATGRAAWAAGQRVRAVAGLAVVSLRCTAVMALVGLAHHTGQASAIQPCLVVCVVLYCQLCTLAALTRRCNMFGYSATSPTRLA